MVGLIFLRRVIGQDHPPETARAEKGTFSRAPRKIRGSFACCASWFSFAQLKLSQTFKKPCTNPTARQRERNGRREELDCREWLTGRLLLASEGDLPIRVRLLELLDDLAGFDQREEDGVDQLVALLLVKEGRGGVSVTLVQE